MIRLLEDKQRHGLERIFRLLDLTHTDDDLHNVYRGLFSGDRDVTSSARELMHHLLDSSIRDRVAGIVSALEGEDGTAEALPYVRILRELIEAGGTSLTPLAVAHAGELGLTELTAPIEIIEEEVEPDLQTVIRQTLRALKRAAAGERRDHE